MAEALIRLTDDSGHAGKRLDAESYTHSDTFTHFRERHQIAGVLEAEIAAVLASDPPAGAYGLVIRLAGPDSPMVDYVTSVDLVDAVSVDLDGSTIGATKTGKLVEIIVASSVACKWLIKTRDGAVLVNKAMIMTSGLVGKPTEIWKTPHKDYITLAGNGVDENFRITATAISGWGAAGKADVHATLIWDEV